MDVREFVAKSITKVRQSTVQMVHELSQRDIRWQPAPCANTVGFLLFHIFRVEDRFLRSWLGGNGELWEREGWKQAWALPVTDPNSARASLSDTGFGWTAELVRSWEPPPKAELLDYGQRIRGETLNIIKNLDPRVLHVVPNPDRPNLTYADYLHQTSHHEAQHQGQIDYIIGMLHGQSGV